MIKSFAELHDRTHPHGLIIFSHKNTGKIPPPSCFPPLFQSLAPPLHLHPLTSSFFFCCCSFFHSSLSFVLWDAERKTGGGGEGKERGLLLAFRWFHMKSQSTHLGCRHWRPTASHLLPLSIPELAFNCLNSLGMHKYKGKGSRRSHRNVTTSVQTRTRFCSFLVRDLDWWDAARCLICSSWVKRFCMCVIARLLSLFSPWIDSSCCKKLR